MSDAQTLEFQAETQQLLDLMIHSLYTHKDIFLRELISNASDALDRRRFEGLQTPALLDGEELHIRLVRDAEARTLEVRDNGIGMTRDELMTNLGTIARSGTGEFLASLKQAREGEAPLDLIGQFGVGFYASFMVAERVSVVTRRAGEAGATRWESSGDGTFTIEDADRDSAGTSVLLKLRAIDSEDGLRDYTDEWVVREIVKRYSDFVAYPIRMQVERPKHGDGEKAPETPEIVIEDEELNSRKAIWTRPASEVTDEEYNEFYKHISHDWADPLERISLHIEGSFEARALLFIPSVAPFDLYHQDAAHRGIQLYVKRIFIMDQCRDLMPEHLRFVKGVVDAEDVSLNVSRELLQQDRQIQAIRKRLVKKVLSSLQKLLADDREKYVKFWREFGPVLKEGMYTLESDRERIMDLMLCASTHDPAEPTRLAEYVERMREGQEEIYFMSGASREAAERSPHLEAFRDRGYEVLFFTDRVDEVWLQQPPEFNGHKLVSIGKGAVELGSDVERETEREKLDEKQSTHRDLLQRLRALLQDDVKEVRLSTRLTESPACLVGDEGDLSPQLEQMLRRTGQEVPRIQRILELNPDHPILAKLSEMFENDPVSPELESCARLLYGQAVLAEGGQLEDPAGFGKGVADLLLRAF